jgi:hypothetical protein
VENDGMKTTLELPDELANEIQKRATKEGRSIEEIVADLLASPVAGVEKTDPEDSRPVPKTLPIIKVRRAQPTDARKLGPVDIS